MAQWIELTAADGQTLPTWQATPDGAARGAVVVLQEIFGVNSHIRDVTQRYAAQGYWAVAPALYHRLQPNVDLGYSAQDIAQGKDWKMQAEAPAAAAQVMLDIQAAIDHAAQASGAKVAVVGFCWGGLLAWRAACSLRGLAAAVPYYGGGITTAQEAARQAQVPTLLHFGAQDEWIPVPDVQAFAQAHPDAQVHLYAADHGFHCDQRGSFDAAAAGLANQRSLAFFAQHLGE